MDGGFDTQTGEIRNASLTYPGSVVKAIAQVKGADLYVQKRGKNQFHGYKYATVGDLLDKLQPLMAEAGLVIFQHELASDFLDNGNVLAIRYQFTLAHVSGEVWPEKPVHTGMTACRNSKGGFDDKAANKCHTAARKYFLLGLFQVPTGEDFRQPTHDGDTDGGDHAPPPDAPPAAPDTASKQNGKAEPDRVKNAARERYKGFKRAIDATDCAIAVDEVIRLLEDDLKYVKEHAGDTHYEDLMQYAQKRKDLLLTGHNPLEG